MNLVSLAQQLIRYPSITPKEAGCLSFIETYLSEHGFHCTRLKFDDVDNLYATSGTLFPNFCFAGHVDVVPVGNETDWRFPPFSAEVHDGLLYGRGAADMKGAIAAFLKATTTFLKNHSFPGSISFLLTSDEEGAALNGTRQVIEWLRNTNKKIDICLVGEPTNPKSIGQMIKVGRRGSLNVKIIESGVTGHVAYPEQADNPIPRMINFLSYLSHHQLDEGTDLFAPSCLQITSVDVGNTITNVIPQQITAQINIRFNSHHTSKELMHWLEKEASQFLKNTIFDYRRSGESFYCQNEELQGLLQKAVEGVTGIKPVLSTSGGTSDARFIKDFCPVIEFGLISQTAHQTNEHIKVDDLICLEKIYSKVLELYFLERARGIEPPS